MSMLYSNVDALFKVRDFNAKITYKKQFRVVMLNL